MKYVMDMHIHTRLGSADSTITVDQLVEASNSIGLHGVSVAEHFIQWSPELVEKAQDESGIFFYSARECSTDCGHILVLGLSHQVQCPWSIRELRRVVDDHGGMMILAHPFRYFPGPMNVLFNRWGNVGQMRPDQLAEHPVFSLVDEIEVLNNSCTEQENRLALEVARILGKRGVAGSDAHSREEIGHCATVFDRHISTEEELLRELRAGRFYAALCIENGTFVRFDSTT